MSTAIKTSYAGQKLEICLWYSEKYLFYSQTHILKKTESEEPLLKIGLILHYQFQDQQQQQQQQRRLHR